MKRTCRHVRLGRAKPPPTLDFTKLRTPADHGDVLVVPRASGWLAAARANSKMLRDADTALLGETLARWRRRTREKIVGGDDRLVIVTGHQPAFVHPGVWAKHIVAARLAGASDGVAVNLVVDSDVPKQTTLAVPSVRNQRVVHTTVRFADVPAGRAYEDVPLQTQEQLASFERAVCEAMGDRFADSQMPAFIKAMAGATNARDWVDQVVAGRRKVEAKFGIVIEDRRVGACWSTPLLIDMMQNAPRFVASYNNALGSYRRTNGIRGTHHPIPDLLQVDDRFELPVWATRAGAARQRLFAARKGDSLRLYAGDTQMGELAAREVDLPDNLEAKLSGWRLRPRALTLTMWARLLLADLFVHGIGGAKYDRISDAIFADYYGLDPPRMTCVSATLLLDLPGTNTTEESLARLRYALRDLQYNPQRNLEVGADLVDLADLRAVAVRQATELRQSNPGNRDARRRAYWEIRRINRAFMEARPGALKARQADLARALDELRQNKIARGREYFFGLYTARALHRLTDALSAECDFRI